MLMLNVTGGDDDPFKDLKKSSEKVKKKSSHYSGSASGFSFEFNDKETVKATVLAKKRPSKPKNIDSSGEKTESFKLSDVKDRPFEDEEVTKAKDQVKKLAEHYSDPLELLSQVLRGQRNKEKEPKPSAKPKTVTKSPEYPKPLPTVDFDDDKPNKKSKKSFEKLPPTRDYANLPVKKSERPKKKKEKFSKVSNPFPNDPSKKTAVPVAPPVTKSESKMKNVETKAINSENSVFTEDSVDALKIHPHAIKNLKDVLNFSKLTHVQQKSIPPALEGQDLLIRSPTGSGKTLSYALPIVEKLVKSETKISRQDGIHALIIVPTRELVVQTYELFLKLVKPFQWIVPGYLSGGEKRKAEKARLRKGVTILISTPGRICDHLLHTEALKFDKVQIFALDEADRLLELGYENDVKKVVDTIGEHSNKYRIVQTILLSATLTSKVKQLAGLTLTNPVLVDNDCVNSMPDSLENMATDNNITIPAGITQTYFMIPQKLRFIVLCCLLAQQLSRGAKKILIFLPTQHVADYFYDILVEFLTQPFVRKQKSAQSYLNENDDDVDAMLEEQEESEDEDEGNIWLTNVTLFKLFGSMTQIERTSVFREFKAVKSGILLCTDVAARGIDVPQLDMVVQYSAPQELSNFYHRIGRTARAGNKGNALLFLSHNEKGFLDVLKEKNIEIAEEDFYKVLKEIQLPNMNIRVFEEKIMKLQRKLENLLNDDKELKEKACKAFTSWICYYKTFSKELRHIFDFKEMHMGHVATNFGLRDPPKTIVKQLPAKSEENRKERNKNFNFEHRVYVPRGDQRSINKLKRKYGDFQKLNFAKSSEISEFDSGLPEFKKKKK